MSTTEKRITLALTKEDMRELETIKNFFGETISSVIKRAIIGLYAEVVSKKLKEE